MRGITSGESLAAGWGGGTDGGLSLLEGDAVRGLGGRSTSVQEGWDSVRDGSLRSLGASRQLCWELAEVQGGRSPPWRLLLDVNLMVRSGL